MSIDESKRLRRNISFTDFPDTILKSVTDYLQPVSQALFAVALSAPSQSASWWKSNIQHNLSISSKAIISNGQWDVFDFGTVEKTLTTKLNDDDIRAVLVCINARNKLKRLYLINCNPITYGLQPLEGSIILEQLDLDKNQQSMSVEAIVPFLLSIINKFDNRLKHLTLPNVWRHPDFESMRHTEFDTWRSQTLNAFMRRYHGMLEYRPFNCAGCNGNNRDCTTSAGIDLGNGTYHTPQIHPQSFTCYECLRNFSVECDNRVLHCTKCERGYCGLCAPRNDDCVSCSNHLQDYGNYECFHCSEGNGETETCSECGSIHCVIHEDILSCCVCNLTRCGECAGGRHYTCKFCSKSICHGCTDENNWVSDAPGYARDMCFQCLGTFGSDSLTLLVMELFDMPIGIRNWPSNISVEVVRVDDVNYYAITNPYGFFVTGMGVFDPESSDYSNDLNYALKELTMWGWCIEPSLTTAWNEVDKCKKIELLSQPTAVLAIGNNPQVSISDPRSSDPMIRVGKFMDSAAVMAIKKVGSQGNLDD